MTLKSALQDVKETTLAAMTGLFGKLAYLASLRRGGRYAHWGLQSVHGAESAERALRTAHNEVVNGVLRAPLALLEEDLQESSRASGVATPDYLEDMRARFDDLVPASRRESPVSSHLSSVLLALSKLKKNPEGATQSTS